MDETTTIDVKYFQASEVKAFLEHCLRAENDIYHDGGFVSDEAYANCVHLLNQAIKACTELNYAGPEKDQVMIELPYDETVLHEYASDFINTIREVFC